MHQFSEMKRKHMQGGDRVAFRTGEGHLDGRGGDER
jgi:hypothetical protein